MQQDNEHNQSTKEYNNSAAGNFIRDTNNTKAMTNAASVPLLYVDDSDESKKAKKDLDKARRFYIKVLLSKKEKDDLIPPLLLTSDGIFDGYLAIALYAASDLWKKSG